VVPTSNLGPVDDYVLTTHCTVMAFQLVDRAHGVLHHCPLCALRALVAISAALTNTKHACSRTQLAQRNMLKWSVWMNLHPNSQHAPHPQPPILIHNGHHLYLGMQDFVRYIAHCDQLHSCS
jgi:hypothetical protein